MTDHELAALLAAESGRLLLDVRAELADAAPEERKAAGDKRSHDFLISALSAERPDDAVLSEEGPQEDAEPVRLTASRVWIVDRVDGTREYGEERSDWAVHVGLAIDGIAVTGAVALPGLANEPGRGGVVLRSDQPRALAKAAPRPRFLVSRTRPAREAEEVCKGMGGELVPMGSAGAKAMAIVRGLADCYPHSGGQYEWDSAAPVAVARHHGLHTSRLDGSPLRYNNADPYLPDLMICRPELATAALDAVAAG